jgi:hypothetical protein
MMLFSLSYLTADTKSWFILTDADDGLQYYDRIPLEFDQDTAFLNDVTRFKAYMRFSTGTATLAAFTVHPAANDGGESPFLFLGEYS